MKVLNLYAGIGGNRKLWTDCEITAVEINPEIASIYHEYFPNDKIVIDDAHQYLLDHYKEYDFIWSSPPCPTHSRTQFLSVFSESRRAGHENRTPVYPDMKLYQEIILLKTFAPKKSKWVVENVIPYYKPLIDGKIIGRHIFWSNYEIITHGYMNNEKRIRHVTGEQTRYGFNISGRKNIDKRKTLRNCVDPEIGLHILNEARGIIREERKTLFDNVI